VSRDKKGAGVLEEIRLSNINKEGLLKNELPKGDLRGVATTLLRVISTSNGNKFFFLSFSIL